MKKFDLRTLIILALCCDLGLFAKRIIAPVANVITDSLHIPGGIGTSFSLMFLVVAAMNEVYAEFFAAPYPARAAFQVAALPKGAKVEIEAVAVKA